jgi:hypothetical protein
MFRHHTLFSFLLLPMLLITQAQTCSQKNQPPAVTEKATEFTISGTITQTQSYCGGARPPQELLEKLQSPRPYPGKKIYFRKGDKNSLDMKYLWQAISDSTGHFNVRLPAGSYCVIEEDQVNALDVDAFKKKYCTQYLIADEACLKQWWGKAFLTFDVGNADKKDLNMNFHFPCFTKGLPCMKYTGPLPQ